MLWHKAIGAGGTGGLAGTYSTQMGGTDADRSANNMTLSYPSDVQAGDLLIIDGVILGNYTASTPSGWDNTYNGAYRPLFFKVASGSESGSVSFSWGGSFTGRVACASWMVGIRFSSGATPYIIGESQGSGSNPTLTPPATLGNGFDYNLLGVMRNDREIASVNSPTPTSTLFDVEDRPSYFGWQWDDNTSNISLNTSGRSFSYRYVMINVE
jgi:hypothetical protein